MIDGKKVLLAAYSFPPLITPQALRWLYISRELCRMGHEIDLLTIKMPQHFSDLLDLIPEGINTYRTFPGPFYYLTYRFSRESLTSGKAGPSSISGAFWRAASSFHKKLHGAINGISVPDIYAEWLPFALKKGRELIKNKKYDVIISSSEPRTCHLAGYYLKKISGVPWIADYGDPWIYPLQAKKEFAYKIRAMEGIERRMLKHADAVTVTSEGTRQLYLERYPFLDPENMHIVTQGFDSNIFSKIKGEPASGFRVVYCGSFYSRLRDPSEFFHAVKEMGQEDIEVVIAGRINEFSDMIKNEGPDNKIQYRGFIGHRQALALEKGATILLHLGNSVAEQVPGKIYEYLGSGRPVLCIRGSKNDLSADMVLRYNKGLVVNNNKEEIKEGLMNLYHLWQEGRLDSSFNAGAVEDASWQKGAEIIDSVMRSL